MNSFSAMTKNPKRTGPIDRHVGGRLRYWREARGLTQAALAQSLGIASQQIEKYERGESRISPARLFDIAFVLAVPITAFFEGLVQSLRGPES